MLLRPMMLLYSTFNVYKDNVSKVIIKKYILKQSPVPNLRMQFVEYSALISSLQLRYRK